VLIAAGKKQSATGNNKNCRFFSLPLFSRQVLLKTPSGSFLPEGVFRFEVYIVMSFDSYSN
jgi:hypothetical protein